MLNVLVFSKDRPMQLDAYLKSLMFCSDVAPEQITVIVPSMEHYKKIEEETFVNFLPEDKNGGFENTLKIYSNFVNDHDIILFGCDDVVFTRPFCTGFLDDFLGYDNSILGFSYRLGTNIYPRPLKDTTGAFFTWQWRGNPKHWGYPFELMASVYRADLLREILNNKQGIKSPNHLESAGTMYCIENKYTSHPKMAMLNTVNYAVAQDVNRVQHDFPNKITGTQEQDAKHLIDLYNQGKRLDWENLFNIVPNDVFVGNTYWRVIDGS